MVSIMLPVDLHARIKARASAEGTTMSAVFRELISGYLDGKVQRKPPGPPKGKGGYKPKRRQEAE